MEENQVPNAPEQSPTENKDSLTRYASSLADDLLTLPNLRFSKGIPDFSEAVDCISEALEIRLGSSSKSTDPSYMAKAITQQVAVKLDELRHCPEHARCFDSIYSLVSTLVEKVGNTYNVLRHTIRPEVEALRTAIEEKTVALIREDNQEAVLQEQAEFKGNLPVLNWDVLIAPIGLNPEVICEAVSGLTGDDHITPDQSAITRAASMWIPKMDPLVFHKDTTDDIIGRWIEKTGRVGDSTKLYYVLTNPQEIAEEFGPLWTMANSGAWGAMSEKLNEVIPTYAPLIPAVKQIPLNVTDAMLEQLHNRFKVLEDTLVMCGFFAICLCAHFREATIIPPGFVNSAHLGELESNHLTNSDLAKYVKVMYTDENRDIPYNGITMAQILENRAAAETGWSQTQSSLAANANMIKLSYLVRAAGIVLTDYLANTDASRLPDGWTIGEFVQKNTNEISVLTGRLNSSADNNLESLLYDFVITVHYPSTMVAVAHQMLGYEVIKQLDISENLGSAETALIDYAVAVRLISSFLVKELCVIAE